MSTTEPAMALANVTTPVVPPATRLPDSSEPKRVDFLEALRKVSPRIVAEFEATGEAKRQITEELDRAADKASLAVASDAKTERDQQRQERWETLVKRLGGAYRDCWLENYQLYDDPAVAQRQKAVVSALAKYVCNMPAEIRAGRGVVLFGPSGTGKDHLLTALARAAILECGERVRWVRGSAFCIESRQAMGLDAEGNLIARYSLARILYISDPLPPVGGLTPHQSAMLYEILDERNRQQRPTWTSLNVANRGDADGRLGAANVDRILDRALSLELTWPSYRAGAR